MVCEPERTQMAELGLRDYLTKGLFSLLKAGIVLSRPSRICTIVSYASPLIFFTINKAPAPSRAQTERKDQGRALTNAQPLFLSCLTAGQPQLDRLTYLGLEKSIIKESNADTIMCELSSTSYFYIGNCTTLNLLSLGVSCSRAGD